MNAARLYALYKGAFEHKRQARQTGFRVLKPLPEQPLDGGQHNGFTEHGSSGGSLQISTEVVGKIARCAALEVDGVAEVSCGVQNKKLKSLLESASIQPPVVVEMRDGTASITLHLMMQFGARIPSVAEKVQENVKSAVQNMTNVTVSRVDLVIAGLAEAQ